MELSKRLYAVASLVTEGASVADIGTDHGYIPIFLTKNGIIKKAIAMDVNQGPLERAKMHIIGYGLKDRIETRLSDGLKKLNPGEVDTIIVAGMGGGLTIRILSNSPEAVASLKYMILQPQSEIDEVRKYLVENGFHIVREDMVEEDGKFYPMMLVMHKEDCESYEKYELLYGKRLIENAHPVLMKFLEREISIKDSILRQLLKHKDSESAKYRYEQIKKELEVTKLALEKCREAKERTDVM